ncbi:MAG: efflux RND transporter periplasmic adaptor subunit [Proteobacteria bacterium]|nr:efflux RND transporter periplasmic adaptor subunit [Pseudomonadota bacterium]
MAPAGRTDLSYCTIRAPISGRIGRVMLTKGNLVTPSTGALATINQLNPIRVVFAVPTDSELLSVSHVTSQAAGGGGNPDFKISLELPNGTSFSHTGTISFYDNQVDQSTGTVNVYADFPNPHGRLLPGAYVSVIVSPANPEEALIVPVAAVQTDQSGFFVLVVGTDGKVEKRAVTLGQQVAQDYIVKSGLKAGQDVIVNGIQKVRVGEKVSVTYAETEAAPSADNTATAADQ